MRVILSIFFLFSFITAFSQDLPQDYYAPYKTIHYKNGTSYGYALFNFSPLFVSRFKAESNTSSSSYSYYQNYTKYKEEFMHGFFTNKYFEIYQYWNISKGKGLDFAIVRNTASHNFIRFEQSSDSIGGDFSRTFFDIDKKNLSFQLGWVVKEPLTLGFTLSYITHTPVSASLNRPLYMKFSNVPGFFFRIGTAFVGDKNKRRFGFHETFGVQFKSEGERYSASAEKPFYWNAYGGLRFFSTSKPIRQLGLIFTFVDISVSYEGIKLEKEDKYYTYLNFPFRFGLGLAW